MTSSGTTKPEILLSFDVEEFDAPLEWGAPITPAHQIGISEDGLTKLLGLLSRRGIPATLFTTGHFANERPELIRSASEQHEIASHGLFHSTFDKSHLAESKALLENITGKKVAGFRRARLQPTPASWISEAGYLYNSSENPTWIPGRYNNLHRPRTWFYEEGLMQIPTSVTRWRFPLFWMTFKHLPAPLLRRMLLQTMWHDRCLCLYFHPWEFSDFSHYRPPFLMGRVMGDRMLEILSRTFDWLQPEAEFLTFSEFVLRRQNAPVSPA